MSSFPYFLSDDPDEVASLRRNWFWVLGLGIVITLGGVLAIAYPVVATITTVELFGFLLMIAGIVEIAGGFRIGRGGGFLLHLLWGLLALFLGVVIIDRPLLGAAGYTLVLAIFFVAAGIARVIFSLAERFSGWGWVLLSGVVTLILGVLIWRNMPEAALWVIGTFVGIDLIFNGVSWVMLGLALRAAPSPATPHAPAAAVSAQA